MVFLCKHCGTIANYPLSGLCEESPTQEHECVAGNDIEDHIQMVWDRSPADLTNVVN